MKYSNYLITLFGLLLSTFASTSNALVIGFGSCSMQSKQQSIWQKVEAHNPDTFILMGDNVYLDTESPDEMKAGYQQWADNPNFSRIKDKIPLLATWDDHDYGVNDGGKEFAAKFASKDIMLKFFDYPELNATGKEKDRGIYHSKIIQHQGKNVQVILLDTRWDRDGLVKSTMSRAQRQAAKLGPYQPHPKSSEKQVISEQQWAWLENQLKQSVDFRLLVSSIQIIPEYSGWESWANFPKQRTRMLDLIAKYSDNNLLILSGDVHRAEISSLQHQSKTIYEVTSSGLAGKVYPPAPNKHRMDEALIDQNYGMVNFDFSNHKVRATVFDKSGKDQLSVSISTP